MKKVKGTGKGKRRIIKTQIRNRPQIEEDESADFVDFSHLQERTKLLRRKFAGEYIKDFNATAAVLRMGYKYTRRVAQTKGSQWMDDAYTHVCIAELTAKMDEKAIVSRQEVMLGLKKEAHAANSLFASSSSRISALRSLAKILGMEITKVEGSMTLAGGVMAVPMVGSLEDWEKASKLAQAELKKKVRE